MLATLSMRWLTAACTVAVACLVAGLWFYWLWQNYTLYALAFSVFLLFGGAYLGLS